MRIRLGREKVAAIHKANIMKLGDGLFMRCCREVAARFPHIEYKELIVDNASMQLVMCGRNNSMFCCYRICMAISCQIWPRAWSAD